ncbi:hypothetical protein KUCAC02_032808, partial [Chaenocephalus aceratus]
HPALLCVLMDLSTLLSSHPALLCVLMDLSTLLSSHPALLCVLMGLSTLLSSHPALLCVLMDLSTLLSSVSGWTSAPALLCVLMGLSTLLSSPPALLCVLMDLSTLHSSVSDGPQHPALSDVSACQRSGGKQDLMNPDQITGTMSSERESDTTTPPGSSETSALRELDSTFQRVKNMMIVAGDYSLAIYEGTEQQILPQLLVPHPGYNSTNTDSDIMLIKLKAPVYLNSFVSIALLPRHGASISEGSMCRVSGWGLPIVSSLTCNSSQSFNGRITENMLCAGFSIGGRTPARGTPGGLWSARAGFYGLVSWGYGCADAQYPGVYTAVSNYYSRCTSE